MSQHSAFQHLSIVAALALLASCAMQPFDPPSPDELKPGPGLFTGETGAFVINRAGETKEAPESDGTTTEDLTRPPLP